METIVEGEVYADDEPFDLKPHKGMIVGDIYDVIKAGYDPIKLKMEFGKNLGYIVRGHWVGHPQFGNTTGHTSLIVHKGRWSKKDEHSMRSCEIETLNSRYTWKQMA
jgi:hypothetical protein